MLYISDKIRVRVLDELNLVLEVEGIRKTTKKADPHYWKILGYYGTLENALLGVIDKKLFSWVGEDSVQNKDIEGLINEINKIKKEIKEGIKNGTKKGN